jgi:hypothetical protein
MAESGYDLSPLPRMCNENVAMFVVLSRERAAPSVKTMLIKNIPEVWKEQVLVQRRRCISIKMNKDSQVCEGVDLSE